MKGMFAGECDLERNISNIPLHIAVQNGDVEEVERLLKSGANPDAQSVSGATALHNAARYGNKELALLLLEHGADPGIRDYNIKYTALDFVVNLHKMFYSHNKGGEISDNRINVLFEINKYCSSNINYTRGLFQLTIPSDQAVNNYKETLASIAEFLVKKDANHELLKDLKGYKDSVIRWVVDYNYKDIMTSLFDAGLSLDFQGGNFYMSALHCAVSTLDSLADIEMLNLLLDRGANIDLQDKNKNTALHRAVSWGNEVAVKLLLDRGAKLDLCNYLNRMPLHEAYVKVNTNIITLLLEHGADINAKGNKRKTLLHEAAAEKNKELISFLLERYADSTITDENGEIAEDYLGYFGHDDIREIFRQFKCYEINPAKRGGGVKAPSDKIEALDGQDKQGLVSNEDGSGVLSDISEVHELGQGSDPLAATGEVVDNEGV